MSQRIRHILFAAFAILAICLMGTGAYAATLNMESVTIERGDKYQLTVSDGTATSWTSSDTSIATVNSRGKVTGKRKGTAYITAKVGYSNLQCMVTVVTKSTRATRAYTVLCLDVSGSMSGTPLTKQKEAAKEFCNKILRSDGDHYIALVTFGSSYSTIKSSFTNTYKNLVAQIDSTTASGGTPMHKSLTDAKKLLDGVQVKADKYVVICSDGVPDSTSSAYQVDDEIKAEGIWVYALGFFHSLSGSSLTNAQAVMKRLASSESSAIVVTSLDDLKPALSGIAQKIVYKRIKFDANGGTVSKASKKVTVGSSWGTLPVPTRSGYKFDGWFTKKSGGKQVTESTIADKNITVYAQWTAVDVKFNLNGVVKDAATGKILSNASLMLRKGYDNKTGDILYQTKSDSAGKYSLMVEKGKFTLEARKSGFTRNYTNINIMGDTKQDVVITTKIATTQYRIVLTWGSTPRDLDAHLTGPDGSDRFHIFWNSKAFNYNGKVLAQLDVDNRTGYGPETTTINLDVLSNCTFSYYVHDYLNRTDESNTLLGQSGATVVVYRGDKQVKTYNVPKKVGTLWHVLDIVNGNIRKVNEIGYATYIN